MKLRDYQQDIVDETEAMLAFDDTVVVAASMGAGKSLLIAQNAKDAVDEGKEVVVLTNLTALIPQLARHLDELGVEYNVVKAGSHDQIGANVHLIMEQSFHEKQREKLAIECDVLIKDEAHLGLGQKRFEDIISHLAPEQKIYYTGTPYNEKGFLMKGINAEQVILRGTPRELTEKGYLAPLKYFIPKWSEAIDYSEAGMSGSDYSGKGIDDMVINNKHTEMILGAMEEMNAKSKKTLVYASSIEHADALAAALTKDGYKVGIVHSKRDADDNVQTTELFKGAELRTSPTLSSPDGEALDGVDCLVSVSALTVGFDAPGAELLVLCRPTKVLRLYLQIVGRVARISDGKEYGEVLDLAQCVSEHGFLTDERRLIKEGDKTGLAKAKAEAAVECIGSLVGEEPTEVTRKQVDAHVEELIKKSTQVDKMTMEELTSFYEATQDPRTIVWIAYEIYKRISGIHYQMNTIDWVMESWTEMLNDYPEYRSRLVKSLRTRSKTIVKQRKKLAALRYFPDWLRDQVPFNFKQPEPTAPDAFVLDENEIPF